MGTKSRNKNFKNLGTKVKKREQNFKNPGTKITKTWEQKL
jgi:hypothetical protein